MFSVPVLQYSNTVLGEYCTYSFEYSVNTLHAYSAYIMFTVFTSFELFTIYIIIGEYVSRGEYVGVYYFIH